MDILLNGTWEFNWQEQVHKNGIRDFVPGGKWFKAEVPGDVHLDLINNGLMTEPLHDLGTGEAEKIENRLWCYRKKFNFDMPKNDFTAMLVFDGLDCIAEIYLNGYFLGKTENAFVPHKFDVSSALKKDCNTLLVKISNGLDTVATKDIARYAGTDNSYRRIWLRKPQFCFKWDWAPRLITCGIWREVKLEVTELGYMEDIHASSVLNQNLKTARICTSFTFNPVNDIGIDAELRISLDEKVVCSRNIKLKKGLNKNIFIINNPVLWFPVGAGSPKLYVFEIVVPAASKIWHTRFGIRKIRLLQKPLKEGGRSFVLEVNGHRVFCKGANWVPADSIVARIGDAKREYLLREAINCNFNMLRVWGGGIYESRKFYDLCDEMGIMIWQDFMYACALYPDDDEKFFANCLEEAEKSIKILRNHPSIVMWCGNNEIHDAYEDVYSVRIPHFYGARIWDKALPEMIKKFIPGAIYRSASPYGGRFQRSDQEGDTHNLLNGLTNEENTDIRIGTSAIGRMMTEFYCWNSPPDIESVKQYLSPENLSLESPAYRHHCNDLFETRELAVAKKYITLTPEKLPLAMYIEAVQRLHGEHMASMVDAYRRNIRICSGALFWMYNDCWPTSGWTVHDYYLRRKAMFYYMKRAFSPISVSLKDEEGGLSVWVSNLSKEVFKGIVDYGRYMFTAGCLDAGYAKNVSIKSGTSMKVGYFNTTCSWPWESLASFVCATLKNNNGEIVSRRTKLFSSYKGLSGEEFRFAPFYWERKSVQRPKIKITSCSRRELKIQTNIPAFSVRIDADAFLPDDNFFDLMPGDEKVLHFEKDLHENIISSSLNDIIVHIREMPGKRDETVKNERGLINEILS